MQNFRQPRFHVGPWIELVMSSESAYKGLLDEFLGFVLVFRQVQSNTIQMIEMNHGFTCESVRRGVSCFTLPCHAGILTNSNGSV